MAFLTNIGKKLIGEGAELFLPFALSKLRYFASTLPTLPWSRTITSDDAVVTLELHSRTTGAVTIVASSFNYEFTTPGLTYQAASVSGIGTVRGYAVKVKFSPNKEADADKFTAVPRGSNVEASPTQAWEYNSDPRALANFAPHKQIWQIEHTPAHTYFASVPDKDPTKPRKLDATLLLVNSWTAGSQIGNVGAFSRSGTQKVLYDGTGGAATIKHFSPFDIVYDIGPSLFKSGSLPAKGRGIVPDSDWYKRSAFRVVESPDFGKRTFLIMTDISNKFYAYPIVDLDLTLANGTPYTPQIIKTNMPNKFVQSKPAPMPSWARASDGTLARDFYLSKPAYSAPDKLAWTIDYLTKYPQYRWSFNSTATRAVVIAYHDYNEVIGKDNIDDPHPLGGRREPGEENIGQRVIMQINDTQWKVKESIPGMVELALNLVITGPNPEDFEFDVTLEQQIDPDSDSRYVFAADYSWGPKPGKESYGTALDDLITMELDAYPIGLVYPVLRDDMTLPTPPNVDEKALIYVRNHTEDTLLKTIMHSRGRFYVGADTVARTGFYSEFYTLRIHAYDLRVLAFMTESIYDRGAVEADNSNRQTQFVARKIDVSIYGVDEPAVYLGTDSVLNGQMDTFASDFNVTQHTRLPPELQGDLWQHTSSGSPPMWTYTYAVDPLTRYLQYLFTGDGIVEGEMYASYYLSGNPSVRVEDVLPRTDYSLGASRYATLIDNTMECGTHSAFTVHPEGHWSVTSPVIAHYDGVIRRLAGITFTPVDTARVKQHFVDIISVNMQNKDFTYREVRTTHVAMFNKAYKKNMTKEHRHWLKAVAPPGLYLFHPYDPVVSVTVYQNTALPYNTTIDTLDGQHSYVVRGSSLYVGKLHKEKPST